jgi:hypothetical protein
LRIGAPAHFFSASGTSSQSLSRGFAPVSVGDEVPNDERAPIPFLSRFEGVAQHPLQSLQRCQTQLSHRRAPFRMRRCGLVAPASGASTPRANMRRRSGSAEQAYAVRFIFRFFGAIMICRPRAWRIEFNVAKAGN